MFVRPDGSSRDSIQVITAPGGEDGVLNAPGDCLVVRAERGGSLDVLVRPRHDGKDDAQVQLEVLSGRMAPALDKMDGVVFEARARIEVVGHVSRRGDVVAPIGGWIAGPEAPARIEGVFIRLADAHGGIEYQVLAGGQWSAWTADGAYAGSRGQHRPLLGVRARLTGHAAEGQRLRAEGLFLGSPVKVSDGVSVDLISESGLDPLVGLKIALVVDQTAAGLKQELQSPIERGSSDRGVGRVRVFRASSQRS